MRRSLILMLAFAALPVDAWAGPPGRGGDFGLGIILGDPTGLTGKVWLSQTHAIDFHVGEEHVYGSDVGLYFDYLIHIPTGVRNRTLRMPLYVGPGAGLFIDDNHCRKRHCDGDEDMALAFRVPFGASFLFQRFNGEAFVELSSQLFIAPFVEFDFDVALGFRYYF